MPSLADFPDLVGFFSYSRDDDTGDDGAVLGLANRIYWELRGQLGRDFALWRDKNALGVGELWRENLEAAVSKSAFFIPMVTPSAVHSEFCRFEFETFQKRERALGRNDLVFPILYITVPELEAKNTGSNPVLSVVAERQYDDWRRIRHLKVDSTEVKKTVELFCGVVAEKLRKRWISLEERKNQEEAAARQRTEDERRRQEAEANRREEEARRTVEDEARAKAEEERRAREAEKRRRTLEEEVQRKAAAEAARRAEEEQRRSRETLAARQLIEFVKRSKEQVQQHGRAIARVARDAVEEKRKEALAKMQQAGARIKAEQDRSPRRDVFICYNHFNERVADGVLVALEFAGIRCWIAQRDLGGLQEDASIIEAIEAVERCRVMVLIFSSRANGSENVERQVGRALKMGIPVVPFRLDATKPTGMLAGSLAGVPWLDSLSLLTKEVKTLL